MTQSRSTKPKFKMLKMQHYRMMMKTCEEKRYAHKWLTEKNVIIFFLYFLSFFLSFFFFFCLCHFIFHILAPFFLFSSRRVSVGKTIWWRNIRVRIKSIDIFCSCCYCWISSSSLSLSPSHSVSLVFLSSLTICLTSKQPRIVDLFSSSSSFSSSLQDQYLYQFIKWFRKKKKTKSSFLVYFVCSCV